MTVESSCTSLESYFCEVDVSNGKTAKRDVWSLKYAIFSVMNGLMVISIITRVTLLERSHCSISISQAVVRSAR
jgi:hypothetical protein